MKLLLVCAIACSLLMPLAAQQESAPVGITFSGFVKTDMMFDSRQTTGLREAHFLLYPAAKSADRNGVDIQDQPGFNILSIQTRLVGKLTGPDALGAKTSGLIEGEFFGTSDADASGFRARHAFLRLDWESTSLLVGQYWHPMFVVEMFPGVVSFNTGAPFQPFSRNPQIRLTTTLGEFKLIAAVLSQRDFQSNGPAGLSTTYLRNNVIPNLHGQVQWSDGGMMAGVGVDYKSLVPRLVTTRNIAVDASVSGLSLLGYGKLTLGPVTLKGEGTLGENLSDMLMLGGYAVKTLDTATGVESYTPLKSYAVWGEISTGKEIEAALFAGYAENLGADVNLAGTSYGRGTDIEYLMRVSPRLVWNVGKVRLAGELEYTVAGYGTPSNANKGKVGNVTDVSNVRFLLAAFLFF